MLFIGETMVRHARFGTVPSRDQQLRYAIYHNL